MTHKEMIKKPSEWGAYKARGPVKLIRTLTHLGFGRGKSTAIIHKCWRKHHGDIIDISVRGVKYRLDISDNMTDIKVLSGSKIYDKKEIQFLKQTCRDGNFVDLGANVGYYTLALASAGAKRILAIEPNPPALERLEFNILINNFDTDIQIAPVGVGNGGESQFFAEGDLGCASLLPTESRKSNAITIQTRPLLSILEEHKIARISGMKIDIEGMEDRALIPFFEAAPQDLWPARLVVEHAHYANWETDLIKYLLNRGYQQASHTRGNTLLEIKNSYSQG